MSLDFPRIDATKFTASMKKQEGLLYEVVESTELINAKATKENILEGFTWLQENSEPSDVSVIFMSGHSEEIINAKGGVDAPLLRKPFEVADLLMSVTNALDEGEGQGTESSV